MVKRFERMCYLAHPQHERRQTVDMVLWGEHWDRQPDALPGMVCGSPAPWLVRTIGDAWRGAPLGMSRPDMIVLIAAAVGERLDRDAVDPGRPPPTGWRDILPGDSDA